MSVPEAAEKSSPPAVVLRTPGQMARLRFWRNRQAVLGLLGLAMVICGCLGYLPWAGSYAHQNWDLAAHPPSWDHPMGTDRLGRDLLTRFCLGGTLSLGLGLMAALLSVGIGTGVGLLAGYLGGRTDMLLMRCVDVLYGLPYLLLVILLRVALVGRVTHWVGNIPSICGVGFWRANPSLWANVLVLLLGIGAVSWLTMARVIRGQVLSLRQQPFMEAARALGFGHRRILLVHVLPNLVGPILVYATLMVPQAILQESFLSFLGLGIPQPLPSWGNLASDGVEAMNPIHTLWWLVLWPCAGLSLTLLCLNFIGDGLRDAFDPKA